MVAARARVARTVLAAGGRRALNAPRFRLNAAKAMEGCRAVVRGLLRRRLACLIRCQCPDRAAHTAIKTCFDEADADVPAADRRRPCGSGEVVLCRCSRHSADGTPESADAAARRRVSRHKRLHLYAATSPLR